MQDELGSLVSIVAVNEVGHEAGNALASAAGDLPLLQDTASTNAWSAWGVTYRDVIILDRHQVEFARYNLTSNDLADPAKYAILKQLLRDAAAVP